ncbi:hypothetical protein BJ742DRAFT_18152 [Cladochytrium replicatum]|nr:hypothetical protein BJ742DRAFT_18152 [Cladochytrium replicatum]
MDPSSTNQNTRSWMTATHPDVLLRRYLPLLTGELLVVSTFLNIQCITVPGWLYADEDLDLFSLVWGSSGSAIAPPTDRQYIKPTFVVLLSFVSLLFGVVANVALFIRMLEKKIKWATRIMIIGAYGQGIISLALVVAFAVLTSIGRPDNRIKYTEGVYYALSCAAISLIVATGKQYQQYVNEAHYAYTMYDITPSQRQLILVSIVTITYTELCSILYAALEGWSLDDAMYWCVTTLTSIGFGDFAPKTFWGRAILLPVAAFGVFMVGSTIYTIRQVVLELFTLQLASEYSKVFGVPEGQLDVNLEHLEGLEHLIHIDQHTPNSTPVSSTAPGSNQRSRPAARSAPGKQKRSRSLEDRMLEIHDISNPPGDPSAKGPLNRVRFDVNQQRFSAPPTSAPSSMPERTTSRESARKRRSVDVASPLSSRAFTFPLPEQKTMVVSRADFLPQLQLTVSGESGRQKIVDATRETLQAQINVAAIATVANLLLFGWAFAYLEGWTYMEGVYFSFLALSTIGYGDLTPTTVQSRAIFIWHVFIGIGSMTYLGSLLAEQALDQWVVEMSRIEKRVGRYETKAKIKNIYKTNSRASSKKGSSSSANQEEWKFNGILGGVSKDYVDSDPGTAGTIEIQNAPSLLDTTVPQEVAETAGTTSDAQATTRTNEPETDSSDQPQSPQQPTISSTPTSPSQSDSLQISTPRPTSVHSSPSQTDSVRSSTFPHRRRTSVHSSMERPQSVMLIQPASNTMPFQPVLTSFLASQRG